MAPEGGSPGSSGGGSASARRAAYPWNSARLDELRRWRSLPETTGGASGPGERFRRETVGLLESEGFTVEEDPPGHEADAAKGRAGAAEGALQGERNFRWDLPRMASKRRWVLGTAVAGLACFAGVGVGIARATPPLVLLFFPGLFLLVTAAVLWPNSRAFQSDMIWVLYRDDPPGTGVRFRVKAASMLSANFRGRHSRTRSVAGFVEAPEHQALAESVADRLSQSGAGDARSGGPSPLASSGG